ncbi:MAG TPA: RodZ domain-containing protein [Thermoanaerobaculia bacterium]|nr:RodZ domain-containing protein [Thermoanaerobaculia bacterium]HSP93954.1 RodZ domain-containing protein [Thermoanaerobaculia bacterium]
MTPRTVLRFGEELRRERLVREITLEEISASTKISIRLLKALEDSDISKLPAPAFTRGFIRSYAIHIGIDPEEKVCAYLTDLAEASSGISPSVARVRPRFWRGRGATAGTIVGGVTMVLLLLGLIARPERRPAARPDKPAARAGRVELKNVAVSSEPTPVVQQQEPAAVPAPEPDQPVSLLLEFDADSWTKLDAAGETLFVGLVRRGETRRFEARGGFRLSLGNAGGVRVTIDGHALESLGKSGQVIRDLQLPAPSARG